MSYEHTLAQLRADVQQLADIETKLARHPTANLDRYINESARAALGWMAWKLKATFLERKEGTVDLTGSLIETPDDLVRLHMLLITDGTTWTQLATMADAESAALMTETPARPRRFRMNITDDCGDYIYLLPRTDRAYTYVLLYVPTFCTFNGDSSKLEFGISQLFDWIVADAAQKALVKDKDSERYQLCGDRKAQAEAQLVELCRNNVMVVSKRQDTRGARRRHWRNEDWNA